MKWKTTNLQTRLYLISAIILLVGLSSSIWIYLTAENADSGTLEQLIQSIRTVVLHSEAGHLT